MNRISNQTGRLAALVALLMAAAPLSAQQQQLPAILDMVPAQSKVTVVVPDLSRLSGNIAMLNNAMNLGFPAMGDALGELKRSTGMNKGINDQGALAVALLDPTNNGGHEHPAAMLFVPVSNYADFLSNFETQVDGNLARVTMPAGHVAFSRQVNNHAVLSAQRELLANFQPGQARSRFAELAGPSGVNILATGDVAVLIDFASLRPQLTAALQQAMDQQRATATGPGVNRADAMTAAVTTFYGNMAIAVVRDATSFVAAMDIQEMGVGFNSTVNLTPNSPTARLVTGGGGAAAVSARLPDRPFILASAMNLQTMSVDALVTNLEAAIRAPGMGPMAEMIRPALPMLRRMRSLGQAFYVPQQMGLGSSMLNGVTVIEANDSRAFVNEFRSYVTTLQQVRIDLGQLPGIDGRIDPGMPPAVISFTTSYNENALQVDGVRVDQYQITPNMPAQLMTQMGEGVGMFMMMGGMQQMGYIAVKDQYVVMTTVPDAQMIRSGLDALQEGIGLGHQPTIGQVRQFLPEDPTAESFISVAGLAQMGNMIMQLMAQRPVLQVPTDLPPIGFAVAVETNAIAKRAFVPVPVLSFAADSARRAAYMMAPPPPQHQPQQRFPQHQPGDPYDMDPEYEEPDPAAVW